MKIYVILSDFPFQAPDVIGAFNTLESAEKYLLNKETVDIEYVRIFEVGMDL